MKTTLILEDDFELAAHWRGLLEANCIRVIHECTAEDAIMILREEPIDLLMTDMVIQDAEQNVSLYGGLMVISYIAMNVDPPPKILAITGLDTDATFLQTYGLFNPDTALRKPVADTLLIQKAQSLLAQKDQEDRSRVKTKQVHRRMRRSLFATDRSTEAIYWVNDKGQFVYANEAAGKMLGVPAEELLGRSLSDVDPDFPADQWENHWLDISSKQILTSESRKVDSSGRHRSFLVHRHFYEFEDDQFVVANATDITIVKENADRIKADSELLRATNVELARSNTELERFAYVASHDLKSPLRGISSSIQFLGEDFGEQLDDQAKLYFSYVTKSVAKMNRIIDDLLHYSRVLRDGSDLRTVDLNVSIESALANLYTEITEADADIHVGKVPSVVGIEPLLCQLFQNLIGNAIKYRGELPPEISIEGSTDSDGTMIRIRDNGIGIEPQYRDQVFEIFKRLHHEGAYSGTGIGLAICQRVMERHQGAIEIESNDNKQGTCFVLQFPSDPS